MNRKLLGGMVAIGIVGGLAATPVSSSPEKGSVTEIDLNSMPSRLPKDVSRHLGSVISTTVTYNYGNSRERNGTWISHGGDITASGVRLDIDTYLESDHATFSLDDYNSLSSMESVISDPCGKVKVEVSTKDADAVTFEGNRNVMLRGSSLIVDKMTGSAFEGERSNTPDVSLLQTIDYMPKSLSSNVTAPISSTSTKIGEKAYFVNYQPLNGEYRSPSESAVENMNNAISMTAASTHPNKFTSPAIFGGVIVGHWSNGDIVTVDGFKTYDSKHDKKLTFGGSGGGVFNSKGQLIGISVEILRPKDPYSAAEIDKTYHAKITGAKNKEKLQLSIIQPVNKSLISRLKSKLAHKRACVTN
jgi:hypothetical protein